MTAGMDTGQDADRRARVTLSFLADPGDAVLGAALRSRSPAEVLALTTGADGTLWPAGAEPDVLGRAMRKWRRRLGLVPTAAMLGGWQQSGLRLVVPGDPEWPTQLDDLGDTRPLLLWVQGSADLRYACLRSVSIVGARAATAYGLRVGLHLAAAVAERGTTVVSGGS